MTTGTTTRSDFNSERDILPPPDRRSVGLCTSPERSPRRREVYMVHNQRNVVTKGQQVKAGQVVAYVGRAGDATPHVAYVGRTGDARTTPPHVHFELHPGGGAAG